MGDRITGALINHRPDPDLTRPWHLRTRPGRWYLVLPHTMISHHGGWAQTCAEFERVATTIALPDGMVGFDLYDPHGTWVARYTLTRHTLTHPAKLT